MIKTIRTWINRIKYYEDVMEQLRISEKMYRLLGEENNRQREKIEISQHEMKRLASLLSGNTWKKGDNMMEAIEAYQQEKYLKEHAEDFLMIMNGNVPEMAARELFEYFEIEVPETEIEDKTAKSLHKMLCNWLSDPGSMRKSYKRWEELNEIQQEKFREDARYLWYTGHQKQ